MKSITLILMIALIGTGSTCNSQANIEVTKHSFAINNDDQHHFGYEKWEMDEDQSVISIYLYGDFAYLADRFHSNVKRIDLRTGQLVSSPHISHMQVAFLWDVAVVDSSVLVTGWPDSVYVLDLSLEPRKSFPIEGIQQKFFWEVTARALDVSILFEDKIVSVGKDSTIGPYRPTKDPWGWLSAHGKKYSEYEEAGRHFFECEYFTLELEGPLPLLWKERFDAINVDFDSSRLVYFDVDEKQFTLYVYSVPEENRKSRNETADSLRREEQ